MIENIIEYVNVNYDKDYLLDKFLSLAGNNFQSYLNCGAISKIIKNTPDIRNYKILQEHDIFNYSIYDDWATGFNYSENLTNGVPPHADWGEKNYYNLLLPIYGKAKIVLYHTDESTVINRYENPKLKVQWYDELGETIHWSMKLSKDLELKQIGSLIVDKPTLLNTNFLHEVVIIEAPRLCWVTRWMNVEKNIDFRKAKNIIESKLNA